MMKMKSGFVLILTVFVCGLLSMGKAAQLDIQFEKRLGQGKPSVIISCRTTSVVQGSRSVDLIQIVKENSDKTQMMVAHIEKRQDKVTLAKQFQGYQGIGQIDKTAGKESFLSVTLAAPKAEDEGKYTCDIYYTSADGDIKESVSSGTLMLPDTPNKIDADIEEKLKKIQAQVDDLKSKTELRETACETKLQNQAKVIEALKKSLNTVVRGINYQFDTIARKNYVTGTTLGVTQKSLMNYIDGKVGLEKSKVNKTIFDLKRGLEDGQRKMEEDFEDLIGKETEKFEKAVEDLARKDTVTAVEKKVANAEVLIQNSTEKITLLFDKVSVLDFLIQNLGSPEPEATTKSPGKDRVAAVLAKVNLLEDKAKKQKQQIETLVENDSKAVDDIAGLTNMTTYLKNAISGLTSNAGGASAAVAFAAKLKKQITPVKKMVLVFEDVTFNIGQGYNETTGFFTAPVDGVYAFNLVLFTRLNGEWIDVELLKEGDVLIMLTTQENTREDQNSVSVFAQLKAGDVVQPKVRYVNENFSKTLVPLSFSTFSGCLIQPL